MKTKFRLFKSLQSEATMAKTLKFTQRTRRDLPISSLRIIMNHTCRTWRPQSNNLSRVGRMSTTFLLSSSILMRCDAIPYSSRTRNVMGWVRSYSSLATYISPP